MVMKRNESVQQSGYGLASFVGFFAGLAIFFGSTTAGCIAASTHTANGGTSMLLLFFEEGLFFILTGLPLIVSLIGICLAIVGLLQKGRRKLFAVLGLLLNRAGLAVSVGLILLLCLIK
jgi:hypothetical protein